jgi:hypothetical protein
MRNFVIREEDGTERGVFTGKFPKQASLKAANRCLGTPEAPVIIKLRERGTKNVHVFQAWKSLVPAPAGKPSWLPDMINKPFTSKLRVEKLE